MSHVEAIYRHGVFEPLEKVDLPEEQRVQLSIEPAEDNTLAAWLDQAQALQAAVIRRRGPLPDSSSDISADRLR
jgi:predicted DNA-binding antitoxin AbrB/MazE fold protein